MKFPATLAGKSSSGSGNATVPNDAYILPPQAFVDAMPLFFHAFGSQDLFIQNMGITSITAGTSVGGGCLYDLIVATSTGAGAGADYRLYGNPIPQSDLDAIISTIVAVGNGNSWPSSASINLQVSNGVLPTLPIFVIDFTNINVSANNDYGLCAIGQIPMIHLDNSITLSSSAVDFDPASYFLSIGISDAPTKQQIINKLVAIGGGLISDIGSLKIRVAPTGLPGANFNLLPLDFTGMTGSSITQGNNNVGTARLNNWTILTN